MSTKFGRFLNTLIGRESAPEYERDCAHCEHSQKRTKDGKSILVCRRKRTRVSSSAFCGNFSYDMLKRTPREMKPLPKLDAEALDEDQ